MPVRSRALRFGVLEAILLAAILAGVLVVLGSRTEGHAVVAREHVALDALADVERAQASFHTARRRDDDGDGVAEYGSLDDLVAAGLVEGPVARDADGPHLRRGSYRVEVLLPGAVLPSGEREFVRGASPADPKLAAVAYASIARPVSDAGRALRSFYVDAAGYAYVSEGVHEADRDPTTSPPLRELRGNDERGGHEDGPIWRPTRKPAGAASSPAPPVPATPASVPTTR